MAYDATCDLALNGFGAVKVNLRLIPTAEPALRIRKTTSASTVSKHLVKVAQGQAVNVLNELSLTGVVDSATMHENRA